MTIRNEFGAEETYGIGGDARQQGVVSYVLDAITDLPGEFDVDLRGLQSLGSETDPDTGKPEMLIVLRVSKVVGQHIHVLLCATITRKQVSCEAHDDDLAEALKNAVIKYGKDHGDEGEVTEDSSEEVEL